MKWNRTIRLWRPLQFAARVFWPHQGCFCCCVSLLESPVPGLLLEAGADQNKQDSLGQTALHLASEDRVGSESS